MEPSLSVIIPSFNRRGSLLRLLDSLAGEEPGGWFEVIVVLDGSTDGSLAAVSAGTWPFSMTILEQTNQGPGAARNAGARVARGEVLLFMDDDMVPAAGALACHLRAHEGEATLAVLGGITTRASSRGYPEWSCPNFRRARAMSASQRGRVFNRYLSSGNFSICRSIFPGFREDLRRLEDVELGLRLERAGVELHLVAEAAAVQHSNKSTAELLRDAEIEAATVVWAWRNEPEFGQFISPVRTKARPGWQIVACRVIGGVPLPERLARILGRIPSRFPGAGVLFAAMRRHAYLRGVGLALRGQDEWRAYLNREGVSPL